MTYEPRHLAAIPREPRGAGDAPSPKAHSRETRDHEVFYLAFVAICLALCALPALGMLAGGSEVVSSIEAEAAFPSLVVSGSPNTAFLHELGAYVEGHLAFRNEMISADAFLREKIFGVSNTKQVVVGADGWIYYGGTLSDYQGSSVLSDRELDNIAFNLSLVSGYARGRGAQLVLAIAPNKNTICSEHMPAWVVEGNQEHAVELLSDHLDAYGVSYVDLTSLLRDAKDADLLYWRRDSHWNDRGALIVANALLDKVQVTHDAHIDDEFIEAGHVGDIDVMLYPVGTQEEPSPVLADGYDFQFVGTDDVTASTVETTGRGTGSLLMFRDSFANNLIPPLSEAFAQATFTNLVPYDLSLIEHTSSDAVFIERAERHLNSLDRNVPILPAPSVQVVPEAVLDVPCEVSVQEDGSYTVVEGFLDETAIEEGTIDAGTGFYVQLVTAQGALTPRVAFRTTQEIDEGGENPYGFKAFIPTASLPEGAVQLRVLASQENRIVVIAQQGLNKEG